VLPSSPLSSAYHIFDRILHISYFSRLAHFLKAGDSILRMLPLFSLKLLPSANPSPTIRNQEIRSALSGPFLRRALEGSSIGRTCVVRCATRASGQASLTQRAARSAEQTAEGILPTAVCNCAIKSNMRYKRSTSSHVFQSRAGRRSDSNSSNPQTTKLSLKMMRARSTSTQTLSRIFQISEALSE